MTKSKKHTYQLQAAKAGLKLFYENSLIITDYEELQNYLNNFASYFEKSQNDKAPNKNIILFKTFLQKESLKSQEVKQIKRKSLINFCAFLYPKSKYTTPIRASKVFANK